MATNDLPSGNQAGNPSMSNADHKILLVEDEKAFLEPLREFVESL